MLKAKSEENKNQGWISQVCFVFSVILTVEFFEIVSVAGYDHSGYSCSADLMALGDCTAFELAFYYSVCLA